MSRKKMFLITDSFPYGSGESTFILPELKWLAREFDISLISCGENTERTTGLSADIGVYRCPKNKFTWALGCAKAVFEPMFYRDVLRAFKRAKHPLLAIMQSIDYFGESESFAKQFKAVIGAEGQPDIVYCYWHRPALLGVLRSKRSCPNAKIISRAHGYDLYAERYATGYIPYKPEADELVDKVYLACQAGMDYYMENYSVSQPPKCEVAYLGADNNRMAMWDNSETLRLFSCSNMVSVKRVHLIIEAISKVNDIKVKWTHAGGGKLEDELKKLAADKLGKKQNIEYELLGVVHNEALREHLASVPYDYFITTTETEGGVPVSIAEACSFGIPVIATAVGGVPELVSDSNGILMQANPTVQEIADYLVKAAAIKQDEQAYKQLRVSSMKKWHENFCASDNAQRFTQKLVELCEGQEEETE